MSRIDYNTYVAEMLLGALARPGRSIPHPLLPPPGFLFLALHYFSILVNLCT